MPDPTTAAEWAKAIDEGLDFDTKPQTFIQECLESYARQRVEAFRERAAKKSENGEYCANPNHNVCGQRVAAAIRALEP